MVTDQLKQKNYFRFLQLSSLEFKNKHFCTIIFLFENELIRTFLSTNEIILRKIKYQWLLDEFENKNSNFNLIKLMIKIDLKFKIKKEYIEIIKLFQSIDDEIFDYEKSIFFFKKINNLLLKILKKIEGPKFNSFNFSYIFQLFYFFYCNKGKKIFSINKLEIAYQHQSSKNYDLFERVFIETLIEKVRKKKKLKIGKLYFILKIIFYMIIRR